jgi:hypothetical protein
MAAVPIVRQLGLSSHGVISADLFGHPSDYDVIGVHENFRWLISAAAQAFGAAYHGRKIGTVGDVLAISFFPAKSSRRPSQGGAVFAGADNSARHKPPLRGKRTVGRDSAERAQASLPLDQGSTCSDHMLRRIRLRRIVFGWVYPASLNAPPSPGCRVSRGIS